MNKTYLLDFKGETNPPSTRGGFGGLDKIPIRRRTHTLLECVRRVGGLQEQFDFGKQRKQKAAAEPEWAEIVLADPIRYPGIMQTLASMALHREHEAPRVQAKGTANTFPTVHRLSLQRFE
jgi:hypothetical protein